MTQSQESPGKSQLSPLRFQNDAVVVGRLRDRILPVYADEQDIGKFALMAHPAHDSISIRAFKVHPHHWHGSPSATHMPIAAAVHSASSLHFLTEYSLGNSEVATLSTNPMEHNLAIRLLRTTTDPRARYLLSRLD